MNPDSDMNTDTVLFYPWAKYSTLSPHVTETTESRSTVR